MRVTTAEKARAHLGASVGLGLAFLCVTLSALAGDGDTERARSLFEQAGELERRGQWGAAQDRLRAALRLRETPQLYFAVGWALENDDKLIEATVEYETAARLGREKWGGGGGEEAVRLATARLADLDRKMPLIRVRVAGGAKSNARVFVDGREINWEDGIAATPVNPGSHVIRVERGSEGSVEQMVYVGRSAVRTIDVDAGETVAPSDTTRERYKEPPTTAAALSHPAATNGRPPLFPWLLVSGGVAFVAGSVALLVSSDADADTRDAMQARWCTATACVGTSATRPESVEATSYRREASDAADTVNSKQTIGLMLGVVGLVVATAGTIMLFRERERSSEKRVTSMHGGGAPMPGGGLVSATFAF